MKYNIEHNSLNKKNSDCLVFGFFEDHNICRSIKRLDKFSNGYISNLIKTKEIEGKIGQSLLLYDVSNISAKRIVLIGCGKKCSFNIDTYKKVFKTSLNIIQELPIFQINYFFSELDIKELNIYWKIRFAIETIQNQLYNFDKFKTIKSRLFTLLNSIIFHVPLYDDILYGRTAIKHGLAISKGIKCAKDLSNTPPNICNPSYLSLRAQQLSLKHPDVMCTSIIDSNKMKSLGMNAYLSVGRGSKNKALMSIIEYKGCKDHDFKNIVFIGKGVTFDSGGISIKPSTCMDEMKYDMSGAAVVLGLMVFISELKLPLNIVGILAGCENMLSEKSFRPGDILTTMSGTTVEVLNTDAEGRLVICDVLTYIKVFKPDIVIDIATLTGACVVALGNDVTGLMSNNATLAKDIENAGYQTDDKVWQLPLFKEYYNSLKSNVADINNTGGRNAGAITAACFLSKFAKEYKWAHLDIAGTAWISGKKKQSTGRPISLLSQFLLNKLKNSL
ncbi:MAG: leucyl aminopeptidase [Buchnera aphidicola (Meitanaphis microgallis)]